MVLLNLLTFGLWGKVGKVAHYAFDAVLSMSSKSPTSYEPEGYRLTSSSSLHFPRWHETINWFNMKTHRLTCPIRSFKKETITDSKDINVWIEKYLGVGEWVMDSSVAFAGSSRFFERKR
ncbi:hypothetical protein LOCC1_G008350 [Lachnellula occidentalis]|uniref:DUF1748-domain-containing protein n=1 Tax=Lachnellula occidentalis TaxID=215460 RepID=A0A8H8U2S6_9HELO|nr:hypothetical protein LOCC1_G008350 [Lachnellula occidentalis]